MPAGSSDLECPFYVFLSAHFAEIAVVAGQAFIKFFAGINDFGSQLHIAVKKSGYLLYIFDAINFKVVNYSSLACVLFRQDKSLKTILTGLYGNGQSTFYGLQATIERKLAHNNVFVEIFVFYLARGGQYAYSDSEIISGTLFADISWRHINHHLLPRHSVITVF